MMLFNSLIFLAFFAAVLALHYSLPKKHRWIFLLVASYYFYFTFKAEYVILLLLATCASYAAGLGMGRFPHLKKA